MNTKGNANVLIFSLVMYLFGIAFVFIPVSTLAPIYFGLTSIIICITGIIKVALCEKKNTFKETLSLNLIEGVLNIIVGVVFFNFSYNFFVSLVLFFLFILLPIIKIFTSQYKFNQFIIDIPKFFMAATMLCVHLVVAKILFITLGITLITAATMLIIFNIINNRKYKLIYKEEEHAEEE